MDSPDQALQDGIGFGGFRSTSKIGVSRGGVTQGGVPCGLRSPLFLERAQPRPMTGSGATATILCVCRSLSLPWARKGNFDPLVRRCFELWSPLEPRSAGFFQGR